MSNMGKALYNIRFLDELGEKKTFIHNIHPLAKLLTTIIFLITVVSYSKYEISGLMPLVLYPIILITMADIPVRPIINRTLIALPFVIGIAIFNPLLDKRMMLSIGCIAISAGWISFISIMIKCILTVTATLILISTTGMTKIALALRILKVPKLFVMQLLLTYRYISVLIEEVMTTTKAYGLRSPFKRGICFKDWGSLTGQLLIRTIDRAHRIYVSMCCRGFQGEYNINDNPKVNLNDFMYSILWVLFFVVVRSINIPKLIGLIMTGVIK
ncbi:MAG: cobalt/nickel transport system permease protein [Clostridium sp.]|jgi:cobalt/nickel transport system permease protein